MLVGPNGAIKVSFLLLITYFCNTGLVNAEIIQQTLKNGVVATAEFNQGEKNSPAILIQHGFLQTRQSSTVSRLYNALVDSDYTVLAPNLSLGISNRKQSLACKAIHSHAMHSDIEEIELWSRWLHQKTSEKIILLGHSSGSVQLIAYLSHYPYEHINQGIFISLGYFGKAPGSYETKADGERARSLLKQTSSSLDKYGLSFCKGYVTTPEKYLSYYEWQQQKILGSMKKTKIPITVIIGSKDKRISKMWEKSMRNNGIKTLAIKGAGHFFDEAYEFELQDVIEATISNG